MKRRVALLGALSAVALRLLACTGEDPILVDRQDAGGIVSDAQSALSITVEPGDVTVAPGASTVVLVKVIRPSGLEGTVDLAIADPDLTSSTFAIPPNADRGELTVAALRSASLAPRRAIKVRATLGATTVETELGLTIAVASGALDFTFGDGGIVELPPRKSGSSIFTAVAAAADGGIIAAGDTSSLGSANTFDPMMARFDLSGELVPTFAQRGIATLTFGTTANAFGVADHQDGSGASAVGVTSGRPALLRARPGQLVPANRFIEPTTSLMGRAHCVLSGLEFGRYVGGFTNMHGARVWKLFDDELQDGEGWSGYFPAPTGYYEGAVMGLALAPDGRLLAAIDSPDGKTFRAGMLNRSGQVVKAFADSGFFARAASSFPGATTVRTRAVQAHGDGWLVGGDLATASGRDLLVVRLDPTGNLDTTFGNNGEARFDIDDKDDELSALVVDASQRIYLAGTRVAGPLSDGFVIRLEPNGKRDGSFGGAGAGGLVTLPPGGGEVRGLALAPNGRLLVAGGTLQNPRAFLARIQP